jgi:hypothetical protein
VAEPRAARPGLTGPVEAESFVAAFAGTIGELTALLEEESTYLAAGRIREGLAREERKSQLAAGYMLGLEHAKRNAVALARFAPHALPGLQAAQVALRTAVERNQTVVATARAVSEGLVRGVAEEVARRSSPRGYGAPAPAAASARPLVYSARL